MEHPKGVTVLPPAGREEQLERWGIAPERLGDVPFRLRRGHTAEDAHLEASWDGGDEEHDEAHDGAIGFLRDGGWIPVDSTRGSRGRTPGARDAGMSAHRGVLHPDEHVDHEALRPMVEAELGFTYDDVHAVYRRGRLSASSLELRARIDARVLELANEGANIAQLGRALGFSVNASGSCEALNNALQRARKENG